MWRTAANYIVYLLSKQGQTLAISCMRNMPVWAQKWGYNLCMGP